MQFNVGRREISIKVVYYGPPLSGKTTNLQALHRLLSPEACGRLTTLNTADDRTLFFDLLPVIYRTESNFRIKLKLFTVPGQVVHAATRRIVLSGADGVVFVADGRSDQGDLNNEYWHGMRHYFGEMGFASDTVPMVIQFNKMDLPGARSATEMKDLRSKSAHPLFEAVAIRGTGVVATLDGLLRSVFANLNELYDFEKKFNFSGDEFIRSILAAPSPGPASSEEGGA